MGTGFTKKEKEERVEQVINDVSFSQYQVKISYSYKIYITLDWSQNATKQSKFVTTFPGYISLYVREVPFSLTEKLSHGYQVNLCNVYI